MALKIKNNPVQFGGHLGGRTLLIVLLVVSLILFVAYARESEEGPIHTLQNTTSSLAHFKGSAGISSDFLWICLLDHGIQ